MRKAGAVILSVVSGAFGFACTGAQDTDSGNGGAMTAGSGGVGGSGGSLGGSGGRASGGSDLGGGAGASGNATGGASGSATGGASGSATGGASGSATGGASGSATGGASGSATGGVSGDAGSAGKATGGGAGAGAGGTGGAPVVPSVLVFSKTDGYRHESIPDGVNALTAIAAARGWNLSATEDSTRFSTSGLAPFNVVVFLSSAGDILDASQQAAFEAYVRAGGGWVGIHAASTTEYDWPFFGGLVGAYFSAHPAIQQAVVRVENAMHPSTATLPTVWRRTDEWYSFRTNPRANVTVLLTLDETSYAPGDTAMGSDHPIAWYHVYEGGRSFYTALGHTRESYTEPAFLAHVTGGIEWAAGLAQ